QKIIKAGELLDVKVLDHLIITPNKEYYSFADQGIL
ncbi:JAB domain-containing protein, partial [Mesonia phycicola]